MLKKSKIVSKKLKNLKNRPEKVKFERGVFFWCFFGHPPEWHFSRFCFNTSLVLKKSFPGNGVLKNIKIWHLFAKNGGRCSRCLRPKLKIEIFWCTTYPLTDDFLRWYPIAWTKCSRRESKCPRHGGTKSSGRPLGYALLFSLFFAFRADPLTGKKKV